MVFVVVDAELFPDDTGDAGAGPDLAAETVSLRTMPEELGDEVLLLVGQSGDTTGGGMGAKRVSSVSFGDSQPAADGRLRDTESRRDPTLRPTVVAQAQGPHPPPFLPVPKFRESVSHVPILRPAKKLTSLRSDQ